MSMSENDELAQHSVQDHTENVTAENPEGSRGLGCLPRKGD